MNKNLFQTVRGMFTPKVDTVNEAGGTAYNSTPKAALAQYAATGCFSNTFYTDAGEQLDKVLELTKDADEEFVAKVAIYAREKGFMKDIPALLVAVLSTKDFRGGILGNFVAGFPLCGLQFGNRFLLEIIFFFLSCPNMSVGFVNAEEKRARHIAVIKHRVRTGNECPKGIGFLMKYDGLKIIVF